MENKQKVLILELWGLGDATIMTSALKNLSSDDFDVHVLCSKSSIELLKPSYKNITFHDFFVPWKVFRGKYFFWNWNFKEIISITRKIRKLKFDIGVSVRKDPRDHFLLFLFGIKKRFGFPRLGSQIFLTKSLKSKKKFCHRVEDWRHIAKNILKDSGKQPPKDLQPKPYLTVEEKDKQISSNNKHKPIFAFHCGAQIPTRRLGIPQIEKIILFLKENYDCLIYLIPDLDGYGKSLTNISDKTYSKLNLSNLKKILNKVDFLFANDSGPAHIASALNTPVITFFGPQDPRFFAPFGENNLVIKNHICSLRPCKDYCRFEKSYCLELINMEKAKLEIYSFLKKNSVFSKTELSISNNNSKKFRRILLFAHTPQPFHGQSMMVQFFVRFLLKKSSLIPKNFETGFRKESKQNFFFHVNTKFSKHISDLGKIKVSKILFLLYYCFWAIRTKLRVNCDTFYYVPAPGKRSALYRDWVVMTLCRPFFKRIVFHWHGIGLGEWLQKKAFSWEKKITLLLLKEPDVSIALSKNCAKDIEIFKSKKIKIIPNGIPDPCPYYDKKILPIKKEREKIRLNPPKNSSKIPYKVVFLSQCSFAKGAFATIEASYIANKLLNQKNSPFFIQLEVAGEFINNRERKMFFLRTKNFQESLKTEFPNGFINYNGFLSGKKKTEILLNSDLVCFPSFHPYEGMPLTIIEAFAYGLPIISTTWRGIPDMLNHEENILIKDQNPKSIARAMISMIQAPLPTKARSEFLNKYLISKHTQKLYTEIVG